MYLKNIQHFSAGEVGQSPAKICVFHLFIKYLVEQLIFRYIKLLKCFDAHITHESYKNCRTNNKTKNKMMVSVVNYFLDHPCSNPTHMHCFISFFKNEKEKNAVVSKCKCRCQRLYLQRAAPDPIYKILGSQNSNINSVLFLSFGFGFLRRLNGFNLCSISRRFLMIIQPIIFGITKPEKKEYSYKYKH